MVRPLIAVVTLLLGATFAQSADLALPPPAAAPVVGPFPAQFSGMVKLSLARDPFYGSRLLQSFDARVAAVAALREPAQVRDYLQGAAFGAGAGARALSQLKLQLASSSIEPERASALLLAHALARPGEFGAALDGLESVRPGLGQTAARILAGAHGGGDQRLLAALRAAGARRPQSADSVYTREGKLSALFDGASRGILDTDAAAPSVDASGYTAAPRRPLDKSRGRP